MKKTMGALCAAAVLTLSACGGGADRPSQAEVKKAITSEDSVLGTAIPEAAADCVAKALVDSDLSDKTLNALVEGDEDYKGSDEDQKALSGLGADVSKCVAG